MKKILCVLLFSCLTFCLLAAIALAENEDDWIYEDDGNGGIRILEYTGTETRIRIPSVLNGKTVTALGDRCFYGNDKLRDIIIPDK